MYRWVDAAGQVHFTDHPPNDSARPIRVNPNIVTMPIAPRPAPPAERPLPEALSAPGPASIPDPGLDQRFCWLRYGLPCERLFTWKRLASADCTQRRERYCDAPLRILRERPAALLIRDHRQPFPRTGALTPADADCLARSGFYCAELADEAGVAAAGPITGCPVPHSRPGRPRPVRVAHQPPARSSESPHRDRSPSRSAISNARAAIRSCSTSCAFVTQTRRRSITRRSPPCFRVTRANEPPQRRESALVRPRDHGR